MLDCVYIGLGSNLDNPVEHLQTAIKQLDSAKDINLIATSSLYKTPPMGPQNQADYINAVAQITTALRPHQLLDFLQAIEDKHARKRNIERWGARTLDLDLLIYGDKTVNTPDLIIPHIGISQRAFVLYPLHEISANLVIPTLGNISDLITQLNEHKPELIDPLKLNV